MSKVRNWSTVALLAALLASLAPVARVCAQAPDLTFTTTPKIGETATLTGTSEGEFPGSPLAQGLSLQSLGDIVRALDAHAGPALRGAQDIAVYRQAAPAVVLLKTKEGFGSGVLLQNGLILTNRHVVEGVGAVQIFFKPPDLAAAAAAMEVRTGRVAFVDVRRDLAVVTADSLPANHKFLKITADDNYEVGADVYAIGHPLGYKWTFTKGLISAVRPIATERQHYTAVQTQTPINPGNSGGPLLNAQIEVVGINTWVRDIATVEKKQVGGADITITRPAQGLNFAVSARDIRDFIGDIVAHKLDNLTLQIPASSPGCSGQSIFNGRAKSNDATLMTFSLRCDLVVDAWKVVPDDRSKPIQFHYDPARAGKSSIIVVSNPITGKWETSYWDFFRDGTFAVIGRHETGTIAPTRFEFVRS